MRISKKLSAAFILCQLLCLCLIICFYPGNRYKDEKSNIDLKNVETSKKLENETIIAVISPNISSSVSSSLEEEPSSIEDTNHSTSDSNENLIQTTTNEEYVNRWGITLSTTEIDLAARILWNEARGEDIYGQYAVVEVILNRIFSSKYPNNLEEVLSQKGQFSTWKLRDIPRERGKDYNKQIEIVKYVLDGKTNVVPIDVLYFAQKPITDNIYVKIGCHYFCK